VPINLGTVAPSAFYLGSTSVSKIYLGSTQVFPASSGSKLSISRSNSADVSSFSGTGTSDSKYTRSDGYYINDANGMSRYSFTLTQSGTVYLSCTVFDETDVGYYFYYKKTSGGTTTTVATSGTGGQKAFSANVSGVAGDVFTMASNATGSDLDSQYIYNVIFYAT